MDKITQGLQRYHAASGEKCGVLLTGSQVYYLFQRQFCTANNLQTYLNSPSIKMDVRDTSHPLLVWMNGAECHVYTPEEELDTNCHFWSLLHLDCQDNSGRELCALLHVENGVSHHLRFVDPEIERLFLHLLQKNPHGAFPTVPLEEELPRQLYQEGMEQLTALYLQGRALNQLVNSENEVSV